MRKRLLSRSSSLLKSCTNSMEIHFWNSISLISFLQWCGKRGPIGIKNVALSTSQNIMSSIEEERVPKWALLGGKGGGGLIWFCFSGAAKWLRSKWHDVRKYRPICQQPSNQPFLEMGNKEERLIFGTKLCGSLLLFFFSMKCSLKASLL